MSTLREFPARLSHAMDRAGKTPAQLTEETGVSRSALFRYLRGEGLPSAIGLARIASCLRVSADWLLFGKSPPI